MNIKEHFDHQLSAGSFFNEKTLDMTIDSMKKLGITTEKIREFEDIARPKIDKEKVVYCLVTENTEKNKLLIKVMRLWSGELDEFGKNYEFVEMSSNIPKFQLKG